MHVAMSAVDKGSAVGPNLSRNILAELGDWQDEKKGARD